MALVVGVDSSTQSTKLELRDATTGRLLGSGRAPHPPVSPPRSEQDPAAWWDALGRAAADVGRRPVDALAIGGQQHGMVVLDAGGSVVRPAKLWNDTESAPDAAALVERLGAASWSRAVGLVPVASYTVTKLAWLRRCEPEAWARLARVVLPHDWLNLRCTGVAATDRGDASGTGYWSAATGEWRPDLLALIDDDRDWELLPARGQGPGRAGRSAGGRGARPVRTGARRPRHRRQHGGGTRARPRARRRGHVGGDVGHGVRRQRDRGRRPERARSPGSPMRPVGSSPSSAP